MKCLAEDCKNEIESKTGRRKFCSDACKMKHFRKHGKKGVVTKIDVQMLFNDFKASVQDFTAKINSGVSPVILDSPKNSRIINDELSQWQEPKPVSQIEAWKKDMNACEDIYELERVTALMKADTDLVWSEKNELERYGLQIFRQKGF